MKKLLFLCILSVLCSLAGFGQRKQVKGKVSDESGEPLAGVTVQLKNANVSTQTSPEGTFIIQVPQTGKSELVFTYTGYTPVTIDASGDLNNIYLKKIITELDDVVVVGYGTVRKKDLTGAVGVVSGKTLEKTPVPNAAEALTGRIAGVQVTTTEGSPDAEIKIRLRGGGSISQDNSPLYIVDGFPVNNISNIAASDISSITFLKDASSTAIYGSRGANGVILITTKDGKAGKVTVTGNFYGGYRQLSKELEVLSPYEYVYYQYELDPTATFANYYGNFQDLDIYKSIEGRNWQREVFGRKAIQQYYNIGISGGTKTTRFNLGLTRNKEESIMLNSGYERNNLNFKINSDINNKLSLDFNTRVSFMNIDGAGVNTGAGANSRLRNSVKYAPTRGLREFGQNIEDEDNLNNPEEASLLFDPVVSALEEYKKQKRFNSNFNGGITWKILKSLSLRSTAGYDYNNDRTDNVWGPSTGPSRNYGGQPIGNIASRESSSWRVSNYLTYNKSKLFGSHDVNWVVGQEVLSSSYKTVVNESRFFPVDMKAEAVLANMNFGTPIPTVTYQSMDDRLESYFTRLNYTIKNKYLITGTFRADASSKFAEGNRWGYFPSAAVAWKISEEGFFEKATDYVSQLKIRASLGTAGNNRIPNNLWQLIYNTSNENKPYFPNEMEAANFIPGSSLYNPTLKWETTITRNAGLDFGFLNGKISGSLEYYYNTTKDLLVQAPLPTSSGYSTQYQNIGSTSNRGVELSLDAAIVNTKDFNLSVSFNIGFNRNKVEEFRNGDVDFKAYTSGWNGTAQPLEDYLVRQGYPVGQMYGYITDGMYSFDDFTFNTSTRRWELVQGKGIPDNSALTSTGSYFGPGALKFKDISGPDGVPDGKIDSYDKTIIGDANPKHTGGFNITASYKGLDVSAFFNWVYGNNIYNANKLDYSAYLLTRKYQNLVADMSLENRFTTIDPLTGRNIYYGTYANPERLKEINQNATIWHPIMTNTALHSWAVEDGSFLRLNTLTIGYTLPQILTKKAGISSLRVYATGYNLYVLTNYSGFDPEVDTRRNPPLTPGVDFSAYPKSRSYIVGVNVTF